MTSDTLYGTPTDWLRYMSNYVFDQAWEREKQRLDALGALCDEGTFRHLADRGIGTSWRCLEVGAGSGTVARWMAQRVGPTGRVVATDLDARFLEPLAAHGIEVRCEDIAQHPPEVGAYDLVHARTVLQHIPARDAVLTSLVRAVRPGGWLVLEDAVTPQASCFPRLPVWSKVLAAMAVGLQRSGADAEYGIALPAALAGAGLIERGQEARAPMMASATPSMDFVRLSIEHIADKLVAAGALTAAELEAALTAFQTPGYTMTAVIIVAAWGRVPA
jgi:SAM-dependent methyltransferase